MFSFIELTYHKEVNIAGNRITAEICDALIKKVGTAFTFIVVL